MRDITTVEAHRKINSVRTLELAKGRILKLNYVIFAAKI